MTIKYAPERHVEGVIPSIDIPDPLKPAERFVPDIIIGEDDDFYFEMSEVHARKILALDPDHYKLWSPYQIRVAMPGAHGGMETVTLTSIDPKCKPVDPIVQKIADNKAAGAAAAAKAGKAGKAGKDSSHVPPSAPGAPSDPLAGLDDLTGLED